VTIELPEVIPGGARAEPPGDRLAAWPAVTGRLRGPGPRDIRGILNLGIRVDPGASPRPDLVTGTLPQVLGQLHGLLDLGFTGLSFTPVGPARKASMRQLAEEVIPALRSARS
jgi:hypothetical protein